MSNNQLQHDYLRDTIVPTYRQCIYCKTRTQFTCIKCGYCYSCHWKKEEEELEKVLSARSLVTNSYTFSGKHSQTTMVLARSLSLPRQRQQQGQTKAIDVYGQQTEAICTYRTCDHKLSDHGGYSNHKCRCRHPVNYASGLDLVDNE